MTLTAHALRELLTIYISPINRSERDTRPAATQARHLLYKAGLIQHTNYTITTTERGDEHCERLLADTLINPINNPEPTGYRFQPSLEERVERLERITNRMRLDLKNNGM